MNTTDTDEISLAEATRLRSELEKVSEPYQFLGPTQYVPPPLSNLQWAELYHQSSSISNNNQMDRLGKWIGLKSLGLTDERCEEMCEPKPIDREAVWRAVKKLNIKHRKELAKENRQNRKNELTPEPILTTTTADDELTEDIIRRAYAPDFNPKP